jgi:hypothetical protein
MTDNEMLFAAQRFMIRHKLTECFEREGKLYKRRELAEENNRPIRVHLLSAGIRKQKRNNGT